MSGKCDEPSSAPQLKNKWVVGDDIFETLRRQHDETMKTLDRLFGPSATGDEEVRKRRMSGRKLTAELISRYEAESHTLYRRLKQFANIRNLVEDLDREHKR